MHNQYYIFTGQQRCLVVSEQCWWEATFYSSATETKTWLPTWLSSLKLQKLVMIRMQVQSHQWLCRFMMLRRKEKIISTALNKNMQAGNENYSVSRASQQCIKCSYMLTNVAVFSINYTFHNGQFSVNHLQLLTVAVGKSMYTSSYIVFSMFMLLNSQQHSTAVC